MLIEPILSKLGMQGENILIQKLLVYNTQWYHVCDDISDADIRLDGVHLRVSMIQQICQKDSLERSTVQGHAKLGNTSHLVVF